MSIFHSSRFGMCVWCCALAFLPSLRSFAQTVYRLESTASVTLTLPVGKVTEKGEILIRSGDGAWRRLDGQIRDGKLSATIDVGQLGAGGATLVVGCPDDIDREDVTPPELVRVLVDGKSFDLGQTVDLGGVSSPPSEISVEVMDRHNALRVDSLRVGVGNRSFGASDPGIVFESSGPRRGIVKLDLDTLSVGSAAMAGPVILSIDDRALDDKELTCRIVYKYVAPRELKDGSRVQVDSVTDSSGWSDWWVVTDGVKMDNSYGTTAGYTWLSEETDGPHWIKWIFPEERLVSGVRLWWAYYQAYRTSVAYRVETLDEKGEWVTRAQVKGQSERQVSEHSFGAVSTRGIRVWQPGGSGHAGRSGYMWLSEVEVLPDNE